MRSQVSCGPLIRTSRPRRRSKILVSFAAALGLVVVSCLFCQVARNARDFLTLFGKDGVFANRGLVAGNDGQRKAEILRSLNEDIDQRAKSRRGSENRLLSRLDRLLGSLQAYLLPERGGKAVQSSELDRGKAAVEEASEIALLKASGESDPGTQLGGATRAQEPVHLAIPPARGAGLKENLQRAQPPPTSLSPLLESALSAGIAGVAPASGMPPLWLRRIEPLEAWRAKGMTLRLHRVLALEGLVDANPVGETDPDLQDFGIRSVHAFALLQGESGAGYGFPSGRIESGYPRSFGIGLNLRLSPEVHFLFDYAHEFLNDSIIEYRGSWESSLVADYARIRPEKNESMHSFFFGLQYVHRRDSDQVIPVQTGFFYSTNMADDPLNARVSVGFSLGGGIYQKGMKLSLAYRLRVWEDPSTGMLANHKEAFDQRIANQFLFSLHF